MSDAEALQRCALCHAQLQIRARIERWQRGGEALREAAIQIGRARWGAHKDLGLRWLEPRSGHSGTIRTTTASTTYAEGFLAGMRFVLEHPHVRLADAPAAKPLRRKARIRGFAQPQGPVLPSTPQPE